MLRSLAVVTACAAVLLAGCGNSRTPVPSLSAPAPVIRLHTVTANTAGISFMAPSNWPVTSEKSPLVMMVASGDGAIALWRYPRTEPLPTTTDQLHTALADLISAARARDPGLHVIKATVIKVSGQNAIELDTIQNRDGQARRVRSAHIFTDGEEVVVEEYAPVAAFRSLDRSVFSPMKKSIRFFPPTR